MKWVIACLLGIGGIFCTIGIFLFLPTFDIIKNGELTIGNVIDLDYSNDGMAAPTISYKCLGVNYESKSNFYSNPHPNIGENISIYCSKKDPSKFVIDSIFDKYFGLIFVLVGIIPAIIGFGILTYGIKRKKFIEYIKLNGKVLNLPVTFIGFNKNLTINGKNPYIFELQYHDSFNNTLYSFRSDNIWYNIDQFLKVGDFVKVYVEENNYKKYWVDISFLPEKK